jgi:hypothetical protein
MKANNKFNKLITEWVMSETDEWIILGLHLMCYQTGNNKYSDEVEYNETPSKQMIIKTLPILYNLSDLNTSNEIKLRLESIIYSYLDWDDVVIYKTLQN